MRNHSEDRLNDQRLIQAFARLQPHAFGVSCGLVGAMGLFLITAVVLLVGPGAPGEEVGPHLGLIRFFVPGYTVSWGGSVIGFFSGLVVGYIAGVLLAGFLNLHHGLFVRFIGRSVQRQGLLDA